MDPWEKKKKVEKNFRWIPRGPCLEKTTAIVVKKKFILIMGINEKTFKVSFKVTHTHG